MLHGVGEMMNGELEVMRVMVNGEIVVMKAVVNDELMVMLNGG